MRRQRREKNAPRIMVPGRVLLPDKTLSEPIRKVQQLGKLSMRMRSEALRFFLFPPDEQSSESVHPVLFTTHLLAR